MLDRCDVCSTEYVKRRSTTKGLYWYSECGLQNVHLAGVEVFHCPKCEVESAAIPRIDELHALIAKGILSTPTPLVGMEFRFLRKEAGIRLPELSQRMKVEQDVIRGFELSDKPSLRTAIICSFKGSKWTLI
jgi:DNA-binding transcriptional regulator YiaG